MTATNPGRLKKWVYVALCLLIVPTLFAIIFGISCSKEPESVVAAQETEADANQAPAEPNKQPEQEPKDPNDKKLLRPEHKHPAFKERIEERAKMVLTQIQKPVYIRVPVRDPNVLAAMRIVPRHAFVRPGEQRYAYIDNPLPIGFDQTISQPYIVAFMTEALQLKPDSKVLEIGTNVFVRFGDGFFGWKENAPFDAIIGTAAAGRIPEPLLEQLKPGGRMILPYGKPWGFQYLVVVTKDKKGKISKKNVMAVRFVPMTGEVQKPEKKSEK
jgi:protein-L-isoaspartate(D-aspartate) O-methyltransferase